jgi:uncharacterized repeat protein (TIGR01451 family)
MAGAITAFRGVNTATSGGLEVIGTPYSANDANPIEPPSITTLTDDALVVFLAQLQEESGTFTNNGWLLGGASGTPMNQTYIVNPTAGNLCGVGAASLQKPSAGATGSGYQTATDGRRGGILIALTKADNVEADLAIAKSVDIDTPYVGQTIVFTLTATNETSGVDAPGVEVSDLLPAGYTYVSHTASGSTTYDNGTGIWDIGTLNNIAAATLEITVKVNASGAYTNTATISGNVIDNTPGNDSASQGITVCGAGGTAPLFSN